MYERYELVVMHKVDSKFETPTSGQEWLSVGRGNGRESSGNYVETRWWELRRGSTVVPWEGRPKGRPASTVAS